MEARKQSEAKHLSTSNRKETTEAVLEKSEEESSEKDCGNMYDFLSEDVLEGDSDEGYKDDVKKSLHPACSEGKGIESYFAMETEGTTTSSIAIVTEDVTVAGNATNQNVSQDDTDNTGTLDRETADHDNKESRLPVETAGCEGEVADDLDVMFRQDSYERQTEELPSGAYSSVSGTEKRFFSLMFYS